LLGLLLLQAAKHEAVDAAGFLFQHLLHHSMPGGAQAAAEAVAERRYQLQVQHLQKAATAVFLLSQE
jgi:hypothetical protein